MNKPQKPHDGTLAEALRCEGLDKVDGILEARLCPVSQQMEIVFDPARLTDEDVLRHARHLEPYLRKHFGCCLFQLDGRAGSACAINIERRAETISGVRRANASFVSGVMSVQFDQAQVDEQSLMASLQQQGTPVKAWTPPAAESERGPAWLAWFTARPLEATLTATTLVLLVAGWILTKSPQPAWMANFCFLGAYLAGGWHGVQAAWESLREKTLDIDLLMILAALGAAYVGAPFEGGMLLFLFSLSHLLQHGAMDSARKAIHALMKLRPSEALTRRDGELVLLPIDDLKIDDVVIVRPGESIPLDGRITHGASALDESSLTGESMPVNKGEGDPVFAGTINTSGGLELCVTRLARDSAITRLIQMVEHAQSEKANTQRFLERAEQHYAAGVILFTLALILVPLFLTDQPFADIFYRAMTVMVVASPCALIISTPASILSAIGGAARNGVLFKGGLHLERAAGLRVVAFDKTGTLTTGKPRLTDLILPGGLNVPVNHSLPPAAVNLLALAAAVEMKSEHPLAHAIVAAARSHQVDFDACDSFQSVTGRGVRGKVGDRWIMIGDRRMFEAEDVQGLNDMTASLERLQTQGKSSMMVAARRDGESSMEIIGLLALADTLREDAAAVVRQLRDQGIQRIVMLTGDHRNVAAAIGREAGVDEVHAELLPEDKWRIIQSLQSSGPVAMIGDGVNDAPALAAADIGIAMGAAGTDVAMETADIVLMGEQLKTVVYAIGIAKAARRIVRQNLVFALGVIVVLVIAALGFSLPLPAGVIGHEGSTVVVCLNGLRLLRYRVT